MLFEKVADSVINKRSSNNEFKVLQSLKPNLDGIYNLQYMKRCDSKVLRTSKEKKTFADFYCVLLTDSCLNNS